MRLKTMIFLVALVSANTIFSQENIPDFKFDLKSFDKIVEYGITNDQLYEHLQEYIVSWEDKKYAEFNDLTGEHDLIVNTPQIVLLYNNSTLNIEPKSLGDNGKIYNISVGFRCTCDWFNFNPKSLGYVMTETADNPDYKNSPMGGIQKKFKKNDRLIFYQKYHSRPYFEFSINKEKPKPKEPTESDELVLSAMVKYKSSDLMKAMELANKAIDKDQNNPNAYFARGFIRFKAMGQNYEFKKGTTAWAVMEDFNKAIELNPNSDIFFQGRAELYFKLDKINESISDYEKSIEINPDKENIRVDLVNIQIDNGKESDAKKHLQYLIDKGSENPEIYVQSSLIKWNNNDKEGACVDFKKAKKMGLRMSGRLDLIDIAGKCY